MTMNREELAAMLEKREINPNLHYGILAYVFDHQPTGHFLTRFFSNDLFGALGRADDKSIKSLLPLMQIVYCYVDRRCHGSEERVKAWLDGSYLEPGETPPPMFRHDPEADRDKAIEDRMDARRIGD
jgi:hypothetical protein